MTAVVFPWPFAAVYGVAVAVCVVFSRAGQRRVPTQVRQASCVRIVPPPPFDWAKEGV